MNSRGFTLIEVLGVLVVVSFILVVVMRGFNSTVSLSKEEAYRIMKNNIISASYDYINECVSGTITCDFSFEENNQFSVKILKEKGYFKSLKSPIDGMELDDCLVVEARRENGVVISDLLDSCY